MLMMVPLSAATQYQLTEQSIEQMIQQIPKRKGFHPILGLCVVLLGYVLASYNTDMKEEYGVDVSLWLGIITIIVSLLGGKSFENLFRFN